MKLIIAEKPSVARDIAAALGVDARGRGHFRGKDVIVTWAIGHLVTLAEPHEIQPTWQKWRESDLPILPTQWPLSVLDGTRSQFEEIRSLLLSKDVTSVVAATDAGREGELIFRYIYEKSGAKKPVERLWLSSLTPESIKEGFQNLRPLSDYDSLADNARGRSRADWLVGLNLTRAYSLKQNDRWTVGRVQTPTLAMVVERTEAIQNFVPEPYREIEARFATEAAEEYRAFYFEPKTKDISKGEAKRFAPDAVEVEAILARAGAGIARVVKREDKQQKIPPPRLYDLTELQKEANRLFGFQAKQTLDLAQALYETHKLLTYPRSDSRYLSSTVAKTLPDIVAVIKDGYQDLPLHPETGSKALGPNFVNDARVSDHHAIIPTGKDPRKARLSFDEFKIFDLVAKRLLMAWQDDLIKSQSVVVTAIEQDAERDLYRSTGVMILQEGWRILERRQSKADTLALPLVKEGDDVRLIRIEVLKKETKPPPAFNDASLLNGMASAGSHLDDKELEDILREKGLGTPATRASTIETLIQRQYIERRDKTIWATDLGRALIHAVHPSVRSAALTGEWEAKLRRIEARELNLEEFMRDIEGYVTETIALIKASPRVEGLPKGEEPARSGATREAQTKEQAVAGRQGASALEASVETQAKTPPPKSQKLETTLFQYFGHRNFRQHQEEICREIIAGHDLLLVMPTGAGKSLCYQLPAMVRDGCTIVISPLIALMDDQVQKLKSLGIAAAALHSGLSREESRAICIDYQQGRLKLLYIAPERLGLSGFLDFLARTPPALVAIDEAHCISQWGHDFRPDYRMLSQRLVRLRPAPVVAMTATATPLVQKDISHQLNLRDPKLHIHGFRRSNIAIEISEIPLPDRPLMTKRLLARENACPAIVYAPTRKDTETVADALDGLGRVAAYHAGLSHEKRQQIQRDFQAGKIDVIVATIAFGMGIDKADIRTVVHTALPSSVEAYYQEIGRAGRDGKFSRAILLHSYADHRTREFFVKKNYPDVKVLEKVLRKIPARGILRSEIGSDLDPSALDNALEKLWVHGAIEIDEQDQVRPLDTPWRKSYLDQQIHKEAEVGLMSNFAQNQQRCRMLLFLEHFGDQSDDQSSCGICDSCLPLGALSKSYRSPNSWEQKSLQAIWEALRSQQRPMSASKVFQALEASKAVGDRKLFDALVDCLCRSGVVISQLDSFEKDGQTILYRTLKLAPSAHSHVEWDDLLMLDAYVSEQRSSSKRSPRTKNESRRKSAPAQRERAGASQSSSHLNDPLAQKLRGWRLQVAKKERVPAYRIFSDRTLAEIVSERPSSLSLLSEIDGIGPAKLTKYGKELMQILGDAF